MTHMKKTCKNMKQTWKHIKNITEIKKIRKIMRKTWKTNNNYRETSKHHWKSLKNIKK